MKPDASPSSASKENAIDGHARRLLLVEDDATSAKALQGILTRLGWQVSLAVTVKQALHLLKDRPDAIILDLMLPDGDGIEILQTLRRSNLTMRVAVTTGVSDPDRLRRLRALNPDSVLRKPLDLDALLRALGPVH